MPFSALALMAPAARTMSSKIVFLPPV